VNSNDDYRWQMGAARVALPLRVGAPMAGYSARSGGAVGIHDPLHVRALVIEDERTRVCLLSCEIIAVDADLTARIRAEIARAFGIAAHDVLVAATHTHAGPAGAARTPAVPDASAYMGAYDADCADSVVETCLSAARAAFESRGAARLLSGTAFAGGVAANRAERGGIVDLDVPWLAFVRPSGALAACVYSLACHPTVLGADNLYYSGDLIGAISRQWEAERDGAIMVGLMGAAGDVSTRYTRRAATFAEVERLAARVCASFALDSGVPVALSGLAAASTWVTLPLRPAPDAERVQARRLALQRRLSAPVAAHAPDGERAMLQAELLGLNLSLGMSVTAQNTLTAEVQVIDVGGCVILAFPGEMFAAFGLEARRALAPHTVLIAGCANDYIGYVPTETAGDGYETAIAVVAPDAGARLVDGALRLARTLFQPRA
jgi:hypothetical protein